MFFIDDALALPTTLFTMVVCGYALAGAGKEIKATRCVVKEFEDHVNRFRSTRLRVDNVLSKNERAFYDNLITDWEGISRDMRKVVEDDSTPIGSLRRVKWIMQYKSYITFCLGLIATLMPQLEKRELELRQRELPAGEPRYNPRSRDEIASFMRRIHSCVSFGVKSKDLNSISMQLEESRMTQTQSFVQSPAYAQTSSLQLQSIMASA